MRNRRVVRRKVVVPVISDRFIDRIAAQSGCIMASALKKVDAEPVDAVDPSADWFEKPYRVAERLSDRLATAEYCIKKKVRWRGYRRLIKKLEID